MAIPGFPGGFIIYQGNPSICPKRTKSISQKPWNDVNRFPWFQSGEGFCPSTVWFGCSSIYVSVFAGFVSDFHTILNAFDVHIGKETRERRTKIVLNSYSICTPCFRVRQLFGFLMDVVNANRKRSTNTSNTILYTYIYIYMYIHV